MVSIHINTVGYVLSDPKHLGDTLDAPNSVK